MRGDFVGANFWIRREEKLHDPYADFAWFRENEPLHFDAESGQWFAFGHADVTALFRDARLSANRLDGMRAATPVEARDELGRIAPYFDAWVLMTDGERHRRLRQALHGGFNAAVVESLRGRVKAATDALLDDLLPRGHFDVAEDFAFVLTAHVLADFLGVHPADRGRVVRWSMDFIDYFNIVPITAENTHRMVTSGLELIAYTRELLAERRARPAEDFLGAMLAMERAGAGLVEDELVGNAMLLLLAGHIAVRNFIGNAVWLLFRHPGEVAAARADAARWRGVVDETLRFESPVSAIPRVPREDFSFGGKVVGAGQIVQLVLSSANRDGKVYAEADRFDPARPAGPTLAFGHGPHTCLGALLARLETEIALETLFRRAPRLASDPSRPVTWYRNVGNRGPVNLPVTV